MPALPPLRLLTTFEAFARQGSMRRAADELNVSQPAVSQALRALEEHVGVPLIDRASRPAGLTEAGWKLAEAAREGLARIQAAIAAIRAAELLQDNVVTIASTVGMATYWLMPRLTAFHAAWPDIRVNVQANPSDMTQLAPGIDIILRYGHGTWRDGETRRMFDESVCAVGQPELVDKLLAAGTPLEDAPLIEVLHENRDWVTWADYLAALGRPDAPQARFRYNTYVQAVQSALDGHGLILGWRSITWGVEAEGLLVRWPDAAVDFGTGYHLTLSPEAQSRPACQTVADWLMAEADDAAPDDG